MAHLLTGACIPCIPKRVTLSSLLQFRWARREPRKRTPHRKPMWLPTAASKVFRIPEHPYVSTEEKDLVVELLEEYFRKIESIRKLFQAELAMKSEESFHALDLTEVEKYNHRKLMRINERENERVATIREITLQKEFQENAIKLLVEYDEKLEEEQEKREKIDQIILQEEEKSKNYITHENLDKAIEQALENSMNIGFCIDTKGNISWEGTPPKEYEEYVQKCIKSSTPGSYYRIKSARYS